MKQKIMLTIAACLMISLGSCAQKQKSAASQDKNDSVIVKTIPVGLPSDQILKTIIADFKGKVVLIDFWATWCPPCMMAMKSIDPIKDSYMRSGKPVAFVYVTGETSPLEKWQSTIPSIKGYHYRLKDKEFNSLLQQLGVMGIPTYYIADRNGNHTYDNIAEGGYPGDEVITTKLEEALNKK